MPVARKQIRLIISENNISRIADVHKLLKDSFKDTLGYENNQEGDLVTDNKRNEEFKPKHLPKYRRASPALKRK